MTDPRPNLYDLTLEALKDLLVSLGEQPFRAKQLWEWLYKHKATSFEQMTSLSKPLRERLSTQTRLAA